MTVMWRVVKKSAYKHYNYVALEFDMFTGEMRGLRVNAKKTNVRLRTTVEFEVLENNEWVTISYKDVPSCMKEFNNIRIKYGKEPLTEDTILIKLYALDNLK